MGEQVRQSNEGEEKRGEEKVVHGAEENPSILITENRSSLLIRAQIFTVAHIRYKTSPSDAAAATD